MKLRRLFGLSVFVLVLTIPTVAFAQTGSGGLPPVTLPIAVTTVVSLLLGLVNMIAQGSVLNLVTVPKTWAGPATIGATFLTGVGSFLTTAVQPWTGSTAFYALAFGLFGLFGGALPAFVLHGHTTLPAQIARMRRSTAATLGAVALVLGIGSIPATQSGCTKAQAASDIASFDLVVRVVLSDLASGKTKDQILQDVGAALGGQVGVAVSDAVIAAIDLAEALGYIPNIGLVHTHAIRAEVVAYKAEHFPPQAHLTSTPALQ
jgi:hypothetical protein